MFGYFSLMFGYFIVLLRRELVFFEFVFWVVCVCSLNLLCVFDCWLVFDDCGFLNVCVLIVVLGLDKL